MFSERDIFYFFLGNSLCSGFFYKTELNWSANSPCHAFRVGKYSKSLPEVHVHPGRTGQKRGGKIMTRMVFGEIKEARTELSMMRLRH
jgi:hypothetical protein